MKFNETEEIGKGIIILEEDEIKEYQKFLQGIQKITNLKDRSFDVNAEYKLIDILKNVGFQEFLDNQDIELVSYFINLDTPNAIARLSCSNLVHPYLSHSEQIELSNHKIRPILNLEIDIKNNKDIKITSKLAVKDTLANMILKLAVLYLYTCQQFKIKYLPGLSHPDYEYIYLIDFTAITDLEDAINDITKLEIRAITNSFNSITELIKDLEKGEDQKIFLKNLI